MDAATQNVLNIVGASSEEGIVRHVIKWLGAIRLAHATYDDFTPAAEEVLRTLAIAGVLRHKKAVIAYVEDPASATRRTHPDISKAARKIQYGIKQTINGEALITVINTTMVHSIYMSSSKALLFTEARVARKVRGVSRLIEALYRPLNKLYYAILTTFQGEVAEDGSDDGNDEFITIVQQLTDGALAAAATATVYSTIMSGGDLSVVTNRYDFDIPAGLEAEIRAMTPPDYDAVLELVEAGASAAQVVKYQSNPSRAPEFKDAPSACMLITAKLMAGKPLPPIPAPTTRAGRSRSAGRRRPQRQVDPPERPAIPPRGRRLEADEAPVRRRETEAPVRRAAAEQPRTRRRIGGSRVAPESREEVSDDPKEPRERKHPKEREHSRSPAKSGRRALKDLEAAFSDTQREGVDGEREYLVLRAKLEKLLAATYRFDVHYPRIASLLRAAGVTMDDTPKASARQAVALIESGEYTPASNPERWELLILREVYKIAL